MLRIPRNVAFCQHTGWKMLKNSLQITSMTGRMALLSLISLAMLGAAWLLPARPITLEPPTDSRVIDQQKFV